MVASLGAAALPSRSQTFDIVRSNQYNGFALGRSVQEVPGGFLVFGEQTQLDSSDRDCTIELFDQNGQLVWEQFFNKPGSQVFGLGSAPVAVVPWDVGFIAAMSSNLFSESPPDSVILYRFDADGVTIWTKLLLTDSVAHSSKIKAKYGQFYCAGGYNDSLNSDTLTGYVLRTDEAGNLLMFQRIARVYAHGIDVDQQGNIYLAGQGQWPMSFVWDATLMKLDSNGVEQWSIESPPANGLGSSFGIWRGVLLLEDGNILCLGQWEEFLGGPNGMCMAAYDTSGTLLWYYQGLDGGTGVAITSFRDAHQDSDSTFIACGTVKSPAMNKGLIYRFTVDGDSLWRREYAHYASSPSPWEVLSDIEPTSDGGMVLTGETWENAGIWGHDLWLLKLDSMGCLVPGCQYVGINDMVVGLEHALVASPNPSEGLFQVQLKLPADPSNANALLLQVFDPQGRLVTQMDLEAAACQDFTLDLSAEAPGPYFAHLSDRSRILCGAKLMIK